MGAQVQEDHLVAKEVSWMHLEVKVEEVLWEVLEDLGEADLAQEDLAQVQEEVQWEDQEEVAQAQEDLAQVQVDLAQAQEDHLVAKEVSWMHLEVKVEEVLWGVLEDLEEADLAQEDPDQVQVEVQWEDQEEVALAQEDLVRVQEDHLVAKEVSWMPLEVKVEEVLWEVLEDLEEADLAQEDLAQVQEEVQWEDQEQVAQAQVDL